MPDHKQKTNVMRILDKEKIPFEHILYESDGQIDGIHVAQRLGIPFGQCYKTLVTFLKDKTGKAYYFVFCIPVDKELDLKKAAKAVGAKSVDMLAVKDLVKITGYIRGGCSPIGMKRQFKTVIDKSAILQDTISVSGGKIGVQIKLSPKDLAKLLNAEFHAIIL
ncbi:MAG: Cys-tRNA(Pro) deacylase [Clostridiales bacterium]|nr:Cys-tRNA(Pro) deacylase [Clostridiales bacterium]